MPTSPTNAQQRSPSQAIPEPSPATKARGIRSSWSSSSIVKRGQAREYEQHAPQLRQIAES
jgi:hypothetical protein